jgi:hypothetical protein
MVGIFLNSSKFCEKIPFPKIILGKPSLSQIVVEQILFKMMFDHFLKSVLSHVVEPTQNPDFFPQSGRWSFLPSFGNMRAPRTVSHF